ncbi:unnamed protein product [Pieris brassicae]|uniref:Partial AB-hydrolase lipase domain-containing protein n=1 Tax=Pieris brassicae TaxID=7116 RepID=A0A9P0TG96_PIEBR|nr:unnamed protein product [Pieris brassicae]
MLRLLLFVGFFLLTSAGRSPHADYVTRLNQESAFGPKLSDNLLLDAILDVPDMIRRYNYPMEEHFVITPDGYILGVQRIPHGRDRNNIPGDRPAVFVMHGLLSSSADYLISGPGDALAYLGHTKHNLLRVIAPYSANFAALARLIGLGEFLPNRAIWTWVGQNICKDKAPLQVVCKNIFFFIGGHNEDQFNATLLPIKFGHFPAGASVRQLSHYGQSISTSMFRRYDYGWAQNLLRYGTPEPPHYNLSNIDCPVHLHYSESDPLADVIDVNKLFNELGGTPIRIRVPDKKFSHIDFVWGIDAKALVYDNVIEIMKNFDKTEKKTKDFR